MNLATLTGWEYYKNLSIVASLVLLLLLILLVLLIVLVCLLAISTSTISLAL